MVMVIAMVIVMSMVIVIVIAIEMVMIKVMVMVMVMGKHVLMHWINVFFSLSLSLLAPHIIFYVIFFVKCCSFAASYEFNAF